MKLNEEELLLIRECSYLNLYDEESAIKVGIDRMMHINYENEPLLLATCSYLRRVLLEAAKIKGYIVDDEAREEIKENIPNEKLKDITIETVNDPEKMNDYVNGLFEKCTGLEDIEETCHNLATAILPTEEYYRENINLLSAAFDKLLECVKTNGNCDDNFIIRYGQINISTGEFEGIERGEINEGLINNLLKFVNTYKELIPRKLVDSDVLSALSSIYWKVDETRQKNKLNEYHKNDKFIDDLAVLMDHDREKSTYYYHGAKCLEDIEPIFELGLGLTRDDITTTACEELEMDHLLLYSRGMVDEIGRDAIVVIDVENGEDVVEDNPYMDIMPFIPSGLQGLNNEPYYYIDSKHIIGLVDKKNQEVVLNPKYKKYEELSEKMGRNSRKL